MDPIDAIWILALLASCGGQPTRRSRDQSVDDAQSDASSVADGDHDALPVRPGINERWGEADNCKLQDLVLADQKLYALCQGTPNRLISFPLAGEDLATAISKDVVALDQPPYLNGKPLTVSPSVLNVLNDRFFLVTFDSDPDHYPGFYVVDRTTGQITDKRAYATDGVQAGGDVIPFRPNLAWGAALLENNLLVATRNRDFSASDEIYSGGSLLAFGWNEDGTIPEDNAELGAPFLFTDGNNPTLFLNDADANSAKLLHNGSVGFPDSAYSGFDTVTLDDQNVVQIDPTQWAPFDNLVLEPWKRAVTNADQSALALATPPSGATPAKIIVALPGSNEVFAQEVGDKNLLSAVWYSQDSINKVFVADSSPQLFGVTIQDNQPAEISAGIPVYGTPSVAAFDPSACVYYLGLVLSDTHSAITAMRCDAIDGSVH